MSTDHASVTGQRPGHGSGAGVRTARDPQRDDLRNDPRGNRWVDDWDAEDWSDDAWDDEPVGPRILWGRIAVFGATLLLAFLLGRVTVGGDDAALQAAQARIEDLTTQLQQARAEVDALQAGGVGDAPAAPAEADAEAAAPEDPAGAAAADGDATAEQAPADGDAAAQAEDAGTAESAEATGDSEDTADGEAAAAEDDAPDAPPGSETYTVEAGDNLFGLAERVYGDGQQWRRIAEANGLAPGATLAPGQTLAIPPAPEE